MIIARDYRDSDLNEVNAILKEAFDIEKKNFESNEFHEIVVTLDDKVCGYLLMTKIFNPILDKYYYLLDYVSVLSEYRGKGIGTKLLEYAEKIAREENTMYIQLTCGYKRVEAHRLYEKNGYIKRDSDQFRKELV